VPNRGFALLGFLGLCLLVDLSGGVFTASSVHGWFASLIRPPGTPPNWLFAPVWTVLYAMMAVSAWLVWRSGRPAAYRALRLWGWQLLVNALWSPAFFGLRSPGLALVVILALPPLVALTTWRFWPLSRVAAMLLVPYLAWAIYATYLTAGFFDLNGL
jgi:tryptophan-rich sensory protein